MRNRCLRPTHSIKTPINRDDNFLSDKLLDAFAQSSFSEEDLVSDLIGFYRAVWETTGLRGQILSGSESKQEARRLCKVVGLDDDDQTRIQKQVEIFVRYQFPPINGFQDIHAWANPRLVDLTLDPEIPFNVIYDTSGTCWSRFCTELNRGFPSEFQEITPIGRGALWGWSGAVSGMGKLRQVVYLP